MYVITLYRASKLKRQNCTKFLSRLTLYQRLAIYSLFVVIIVVVVLLPVRVGKVHVFDILILCGISDANIQKWLQLKF